MGGMGNKNCKSSVGVIVASVLLLGLPLIVYIFGYFWLCTRVDWADASTGIPSTIERVYAQKWISDAYFPLVGIESKWRGVAVIATFGDGTVGEATRHSRAAVP